MTEREKEFRRSRHRDARTIEDRVACSLNDQKLTDGSRVAEAENARYYAKAAGIWDLLNSQTRKMICFAMLGIFPKFEYVMTITIEEDDDAEGDAPRDRREWKAGSLF